MVISKHAVIKLAKIKDATPNPERSESLKKMAEKTLERIEDTDSEKYPTQVLRDYYNVVHYYLEAISTKEGKKIDGRGAHAELISFVCGKHGVQGSKEQFLQEMRKYRNRISYEGFFTDSDYLERNGERIKELIEGFREILSKI